MQLYEDEIMLFGMSYEQSSNLKEKAILLLKERRSGRIYHWLLFVVLVVGMAGVPQNEQSNYVRL